MVVAWCACPLLCWPWTSEIIDACYENGLASNSFCSPNVLPNDPLGPKSHWSILLSMDHSWYSWVWDSILSYWPIVPTSWEKRKTSPGFPAGSRFCGQVTQIMRWGEIGLMMVSSHRKVPQRLKEWPSFYIYFLTVGFLCFSLAYRSPPAKASNNGCFLLRFLNVFTFRVSKNILSSRSVPRHSGPHTLAILVVQGSRGIGIAKVLVKRTVAPAPNTQTKSLTFPAFQPSSSFSMSFPRKHWGIRYLLMILWNRNHFLGSKCCSSATSGAKEQVSISKYGRRSRKACHPLRRLVVGRCWTFGFWY